VHETHLSERLPTGRLQEFREGLAFVFHRRDIAIYTVTKSLWSLGGGVLLLLTLFRRKIFPLGVDGALSIGLLYAARGVGAGIGPLLARRFGGDGQQFLRRAIGPSIILTGIGYAVVSGSPSLLLATVGVMVAHIGGSTQWVFSTSLLQMNVPNRLQGRVFAVEGAFLTLATALSSYMTGVASDAGWSPPALALLLSGGFRLPRLALCVDCWR